MQLPYPPPRGDQDFPYALNGLIPLAAASNDPRLKQQCYDGIARVLETARGGTEWLTSRFFLGKTGWYTPEN